MKIKPFMLIFRLVIFRLDYLCVFTTENQNEECLKTNFLMNQVTVDFYGLEPRRKLID